MKALFETIKTLLTPIDKKKADMAQINDLNLLEKWWLNDEILNSVQLNGS